MNSFNDQIKVLNKPIALHVFDDSLPTPNGLFLTASVHGRDTFSINTGIGFQKENNSFVFNSSDEFLVTFGRAWSYFFFKLQVFGPKLSFQADFDHHPFRFKSAGKNQLIWLNPYIGINTNRNFDKCRVNVGTLSVWNRIGLSMHEQLSFYKIDGKHQVDITAKTNYRYRGYFFNSILSANTHRPLETKIRELILGKEIKELTAAIKLTKNTPGSYLNWSDSRATASLAYNLRQYGVTGVELSRGLNESGRPKFTVAYQNRLSRQMFFRIKANCSLEVYAATEVTFSNGISFETAIRGAPKTLIGNNGFLGLPIAFGAKFSIDR